MSTLVLSTQKHKDGLSKLNGELAGDIGDLVSEWRSVRVYETAMISGQALPISDIVPASAKATEVIGLGSSSPISSPFPAIEAGGKEEMASPPKPKPERKRFFVVRDSLDSQAGRFYEADDEKVKDRSRAYRYSQVEVLDLTGDS
jgi:holliday junction resolvase YEN1